MNASVSKNEIFISSSGDNLYFNVNFKKEDNILYSEILYDLVDNRKTAIKMYLAIILADCVGQVKGYSEREITKALSDKNALNYTIENEGIEMKKKNDETGILIKIDLNNDFSSLKKIN